MTFTEVTITLKEGKKTRRTNWRKASYIVCVGSHIEYTVIDNGSYTARWHPKIEDLAADDWTIVQ